MALNTRLLGCLGNWCSLGYEPHMLKGRRVLGHFISALPSLVRSGFSSQTQSKQLPAITVFLRAKVACFS